MASAALAYSSLGDEVEYSSPALGITRIPVLDSGILDLGILLDHYLHHSRMQLVLITHRSGTAFHIAHIRAFISNNQGPFKLPCSLCIDSEIAGKLHRTSHPFRDVTE